MGKILLVLLAGFGLLPDLPTRPVGPLLPLESRSRIVEHLDGLVRLPPLVSPGETIEFVPLNLAKTPLGGRWLIAGVEARAVTAADGSTRLRVQLPAHLDPLEPLEVAYLDAKGKKLVAASGFEQVRIVPPMQADPAPRLSRCGTRWVQDGVACVCGWFPGESVRGGILIDGRPASSFVAASQRSVCSRVGLGTHRLSGSIAAGFDPARDDDRIDAVQIRRFPPFLSLRPLQSTAITWMVLGTKEPVRLRLRNTAPDLATLQGGTLQTVATSGGLRNAASRNVTWLAGSGPFRIEAEVEDNGSPFLGKEYLAVLAEVFQREVRRIAADFEARLGSLPDDRNLSQQDLRALLSRTREEIPRSLPYPELTAFRDASADLLEETMARIDLLSGSEIERKRVQPLLKQVLDFLATSGEAPQRSLCILSSPVDGAIVKIYPRSLPAAPVETSTADIVSHLFPGVYRYEVWKESFKQVESEIDLTGDTRLVLDCRLVRASDRDGPTPCRLASASERDAERCRWD